METKAQIKEELVCLSPNLALYPNERKKEKPQTREELLILVQIERKKNEEEYQKRIKLEKELEQYKCMGYEEDMDTS